MKKLICLTLLTGMAATPAFAQDDVGAANFAGPRVEILAGMDMLRPGGDEDSQTELAYGLAAGFDIVFGNLVVGVEGEMMRSTLDECEEDVIVADDELCVRARDFSIGGRVGGVVGDGILLYGKAGYTQLRPDVDYDGPNSDELDDLLDDEEFEHLDGVRVGVGAEGTFGMGLAKVEYRYSNFENGVSRHQLVAGLGIRF